MRTPLATIKKIRKLHSQGASYAETAKMTGLNWYTVRAWVFKGQGKCGKCGTPSDSLKLFCDNCLFKFKLYRNK